MTPDRAVTFASLRWCVKSVYDGQQEGIDVMYAALDAIEADLASPCPTCAALAVERDTLLRAVEIARRETETTQRALEDCRRDRDEWRTKAQQLWRTEASA